MNEAQREAWNAIVASGDAEAIAAAKRDILRGIFTEVMDDDPRYVQAGWKRGAGNAR